MASNSVSHTKTRCLIGCTEFQLHTDGLDANIIDFTERKLIRYAQKENDPKQKLLLMALVIDYTSGKVAVAWRQGRPIPLRIVHES